VALESAHHRCLVIGEDLTVPDGLREALLDAGISSYRLLYFEQDAAVSRKPRLAAAGTGRALHRSADPACVLGRDDLICGRGWISIRRRRRRHPSAGGGLQTANAWWRPWRRKACRRAPMASRRSNRSIASWRARRRIC
jgi:hypothetical protein